MGYDLSNYPKRHRKKEIRPEVNADEVANVIIYTLDGAVMMSKLYENSNHLKIAVNHLNQYMKSLS